jgi:hypothetical protein
MPIGFNDGEHGGGRTSGGGVSPGEFLEVVRAGSPVIGQVWTRWETAEDERVCPECGPLDGKDWPAHEGPQPPLHNLCRCARVVAFVDWQTRPLVRRSSDATS